MTQNIICVLQNYIYKQEESEHTPARYKWYNDLKMMYLFKELKILQPMQILCHGFLKLHGMSCTLSMSALAIQSIRLYEKIILWKKIKTIIDFIFETFMVFLSLVILCIICNSYIYKIILYAI